MAKQDKKEEGIDDVELAKIQKESEDIENKRAQEAEKRKLERETREAEASKGTYTKEQVDEQIRQAIAAFKRSEEGLDELDEADPFKTKKLTIPRFPNKDKEWKFIVGFANTNTDEYFKEKVVQAFDIWDDLTKRNVAYVKVLFEDDSEMTLPLLTVIKKSQKVLVDIIEIPKKDTSYSAGRTEIRRVEQYESKSQGTIPMKVTKYDYSFLVKLPNGRELAVSKEVVNWNIIPDTSK
jgi:hypothetical protein